MKFNASRIVTILIVALSQCLIMVQAATPTTIGKITDDTTGLAIGDVKVTIKNNSEVQPQITGDSGLFDIAAKVGDILLIQKEGYVEQSITVKDDRVARVQLIPVAKENYLNTLLSTGNGAANTVSRIPASVIVVTKQEIADMGYSNIEEVLANVPGLYTLEEYQGKGSNVGVRGFLTSGGNNSMMVMVNSITQYEDLNGEFSFSGINIPIEAIERIEIVRGPMSVAYGGSGALMGAINIITQKNSTIDSSSFSVTASSNDTRRISAQFHATGDFNQTLIAAIEKGDHGDFDFNELTPGASITAYDTLEYDKLYVSYLADYNNGFTFNANLAQVDKGIIGPPGYTDSGIQQTNRQFRTTKQYNFQLGYQKKWLDGDALQTNAKLSYYNYAFADEYIYGGIAWESVDSGSSAYQYEFDMLFNGEDSKWNSPFNLSFGITQRVANEVYWDLIDISSQFYSRLPQNAEINLQSAYAQIDYHGIEDLLISAGIRVEQGNDYDVEIAVAMGSRPDIVRYPYENPSKSYIPRIGLVYSMDDRNIFKALYSVGVRQTSFFKKISKFFTNETDNWSHEQVKTYEFIYLNQYKDEDSQLGLNSQINLFYNQLDDLGFIVRTWPVIYESRKGKTVGVEFSTELNYKQTVASAAISYQESSFDSVSRLFSGINARVPLSPELLAYFKLRHNYNENISFGTAIRYVDEMYNDLGCREALETDGENCTHLAYFNRRIKSDSGWLMDINVNYNLDLSSLSYLTDKPMNLGFSVKNVFDSQRRYPLSVEGEWVAYGFPITGRRVEMALKYPF